MALFLQALHMQPHTSVQCRSHRLAPFALHADPEPWLTGLRTRSNLYYLTDAARMNVAVSLLPPEVRNVWAHAFPAGMQCTFAEFCEWLASNFSNHDADADIIRTLQS